MKRTSWAAGAIVLSTLIAPAKGADARLDRIRVAPGWKVEVAASEPLVLNPVTMTFGPDGRLYVVEWMAGRGPNDRIRALKDVDGDGTFDEASLYMDGLELPAGLLFWDGWTYLTLGHDVVRLRDHDGDGRFEVREVVVSGFPHNDSHHRVSGMTIGPDGWLYLTAADGDIQARGSDGSEANVLRSGGVFRCRPDGSALEVFAFGMRNPWGNVAFDGLGRMFHTDNDSESTADFTGCRLLHVVAGGDYGWRVRDGARCCVPDPERSTWNGGRPGRLGWIAETGRGAPTGVCLLDSGAFPERMRGMLVEPDVFRKTVRGFALKPVGATFAVADEVEILASDDGLFRPDDAEIGPDGALYILDWRTDSGGASQLAGNGTIGRVYRLTWGGTESDPARPTFSPGRFAGIESVGEDALFDGLADAEPGARRASARELARRVATPGDGSKAIWDRAAKEIADPSRPIAARAALILLAGGTGPGRGAPEVAPTQFRAEPILRRLAYAATPADAGDVARAALLKANESNPALAREQAMALGRSGRTHPGGESAIAAKLLTMANTFRFADPVVRDGIARGLGSLGPAAREAIVAKVADPNRTQKRIGRLALQSWRDDDALGDLLALATTEEEIPAPERVNLFLGLREMATLVPPGPVAAWLAGQPQADLAPRVEAIRLLTAIGALARDAAGPILPRLIDDEDAPVRRAAMALAAATRPGSARSALIVAVADRSRSADERSLAVAALRGSKDRAIAPALVDILGSATDPGLKGEAVRALASLDFAAASSAAVGLLGDADAGLRGDAVAVLAQKPATTLDLLRAARAGTVPPGDVPKVVEAARRHSDPEVRAAVVDLMRDRMRGPSAVVDVGKLEEQARRSGDPARGRRVFLDASKANCASCHRMEGTGGAVGPDLTRIWETMTFAKRVESILEPSREIKEGYATYRVETEDGRVVSGLLVADRPDGVTLRDAQGREIRVPSGEIERKGADPSSLMPEGIVAALSHDEFVDLLAFLGDRSAQESLRVEIQK